MFGYLLDSQACRVVVHGNDTDEPFVLLPVRGYEEPSVVAGGEFPKVFVSVEEALVGVGRRYRNLADFHVVEVEPFGRVHHDVGMLSDL